MRSGWKKSTLGEACEMYQPKTISTKEMIPDGKYPVFGANGIIGKYDKFNHEEPQLLVTCRGATCGAVNISLPMSWITGNAMVVRPRTGEIGMRFLEYLFRGGIDISHAITGAAQPQITRTSLIPIEFSYPASVDEQKRIVAILDDAFERIDTALANTEKNLANARELFESYLEKNFTEQREEWTQDIFENLVESTMIGLVKSAREQGEGLPYVYIKMNNIGNDKSFCQDKVTNVSATSSEILKYSLQDQDFLFNTRNSHELVGKSCLYRSISNDPVLFNNNIMRVRFKKKLLPEFVSYAFMSQFISDQLETIKHGTTNVSAIYYKSLKDIRISHPPLSAQLRIVDQLNEIDSVRAELEKLYSQKLFSLTILKQSLLQKAFSGELTMDFNPDALEQ